MTSTIEARADAAKDSGAGWLRRQMLLVLALGMAQFPLGGCAPKVFRFGVRLENAAGDPRTLINDVHYTCADPVGDESTAKLQLEWRARGRTTLETYRLDPESGQPGTLLETTRVAADGLVEKRIAQPIQFTLIADRDFLRRVGPPDLQRQQVLVLDGESDAVPYGATSECVSGRLRAKFINKPALFHRNVVVREVRLEESMLDAFDDPEAVLVVRHDEVPTATLRKLAPQSSALGAIAPGGSWELEYIPPPGRSSSCDELRQTDALRILSVEVVLGCSSGQGAG